MATERDTFGAVDDDTPVRRSALDFLRSMHEQAKAAQVRTVVLRDPSRPEYALTCEVPSDLDATEDINARAEKAAKSANAPGESVIGNCMLLARYTRRLQVRGQDVCDDHDAAVFADPAVQEAVGAPNAWRAVRETFLLPGNKFDDGVVARLARALLVEGGLTRSDGVEVEQAQDPT